MVGSSWVRGEGLVMSLPERINAMTVLSYVVADIVDDLRKTGIEDPTMEDVMGIVEEYARDDLGYGLSIIFQDENGEEL